MDLLPTPSSHSAPAATWRGHALSCLLLAALIAIVYAPSLAHAPRVDQWAYFLETAGRDGFLDIYGHTYSYNRMTRIYSGDTQLFRPGFFVVPALQRAYFGTRFALCQGTGIVLHVLVCWLLLGLLRRWCAAAGGSGSLASPSTYLPLAMTLFFALNFAIVEQVIWYNINSYLAAVAMILGSLSLLARAELGPTTSKGTARLLYVAAWLLALAAAFTYELGQGYALCAGVGLGTLHGGKGRRRRGLTLLAAFAAIAVIYQGANAFDRWHQRGHFTDDVALRLILARACTLPTLEHAAHYGVYTLVQPFFPWTCGMRLIPYGKLYIGEQLWEGAMPLTPMLGVAVAIFILVVSLAGRGAWRLVAERHGPPLVMIFIALGTAAGHAALVILGRMNVRTWENFLSVNPYYTYITLLFTLVGVSAAMMWGAGDSRVRRGAAWLLVVGLLASAGASGRKVHRLNVKIVDIQKTFRAWNDSLRSFVEAHASESDFSFAVVPRMGQAMPDNLGIPNPWLFFDEYMRTDSPKYVLTFSNCRFHALATGAWWKTRPDLAETGRHFPELIRIGADYHIFRADGWYYAVSTERTKPFLASLGAESECIVRDRDMAALVRRVEEVGLARVSRSP